MSDNSSVRSISRHISIGESCLNSCSTKKNEWVLENVGTERAGAEATYDGHVGDDIFTLSVTPCGSRSDKSPQKTPVSAFTQTLCILLVTPNHTHDQEL